MLREAGPEPRGAGRPWPSASCTGRRPAEAELGAARCASTATSRALRRDDAAARRSRMLGERGGRDPDARAELAAWTMVANVLLNLDETLTKE